MASRVREMKELDVKPEELDKAVAEAMGDKPIDELARAFDESMRDFAVDTILKGHIVGMINDDVIVDIGYKSEGVLSRFEFPRPEEIKVGDEVEVFLESIEDEAGLIQLSKQKADRIRGWERIMSQSKEGDTVRGRVGRKIKGGLLVDIGVPVFLPASQVDLRRVEDVGEYIGREIEAKIIKIDDKRMNIIISRRKLLEEMRESMKQKLLSDIKEGEVRAGQVKNIADFGAFVDLGGIDGLLHITDMSWGRVSHPSEVVAIDQHIHVKILKVDLARERIALGLKQLSESPWSKVATKYPAGSALKGKVVNLLPYGAFVELETGVEGLVHVSEMSWTKRINHPSEVVAIGDAVDVVVLDVNMQKQEISLSMKRTEVNPWTLVEQKYPAGTKIRGKVRNMTNYGAFIEIEEGIDGLLHISDMSWTKKITHPSEMVKKGQTIDAVVLSVDPEKKRVALGLKQTQENPWDKQIPEKYIVGAKIIGRVTKLTSFGAFVALEEDLEGLLHVSKMAGQAGQAPDKILAPGDSVEVEVIRVEPQDGKIGLSLLRVVESGRSTAADAPPVEGGATAPAPAAPEAPAAEAGAGASPA